MMVDDDLNISVIYQSKMMIRAHCSRAAQDSLIAPRGKKEISASDWSGQTAVSGSIPGNREILAPVKRHDLENVTSGQKGLNEGIVEKRPQFTVEQRDFSVSKAKAEASVLSSWQ
jgi:hypothetical protein